MHRRKSGFTLIEILVVFSIISVLAGLVLGALSVARERARQTICCSNLGQLGKAVSMYMDDNNLFLPMAMQEDEALGMVYYTDLLVVPYVVPGTPDMRTASDQIAFGMNLRIAGKLNAVFYCPDAGNHTTPNYGVNAYNDKPVTGPNGQSGTHQFGLCWAMRSGGFAPISTNEIPNAGSTIYLVDSKPGPDFWHVGQSAASAQTPVTDFTTLDARHSSHYCVLYLDWHAQAIYKEDPDDWGVLKPSLQ